MGEIIDIEIDNVKDLIEYFEGVDIIIGNGYIDVELIPRENIIIGEKDENNKKE